MNASEAVNLQHDGRDHSVIAEMIDEIKHFVQTRTDLNAEIRQKLPHLRNAAVLGLGGGLLLVTGYLFVAIAVVVLIASAFPQNLYRWFFGFLIVGIVSLGFGAIGAFLAKSEIDLRSILPGGTFKVSKDGKDWVKDEIQQQK